MFPQLMSLTDGQLMEGWIQSKWLNLRHIISLDGHTTKPVHAKNKWFPQQIVLQKNKQDTKYHRCSSFCARVIMSRLRCKFYSIYQQPYAASISCKSYKFQTLHFCFVLASKGTNFIGGLKCRTILTIHQFCRYCVTRYIYTKPVWHQKKIKQCCSVT